MNLTDFLKRQKEFSEKTFGPGKRTTGICNHIKKELEEIKAEPTDLMEWIDVAILAFDGAWRSGHSPEEVSNALMGKQNTNMSREWPDWRGKGEDEPIEHDRDADVNAMKRFSIMNQLKNAGVPPACNCGSKMYRRKSDGVLECSAYGHTAGDQV